MSPNTDLRGLDAWITREPRPGDAGYDDSEPEAEAEWPPEPPDEGPGDYLPFDPDEEGRTKEEDDHDAILGLGDLGEEP